MQASFFIIRSYVLRLKDFAILKLIIKDNNNTNKPAKNDKPKKLNKKIV